MCPSIVVPKSSVNIKVRAEYIPVPESKGSRVIMAVCSYGPGLSNMPCLPRCHTDRN